MARAKRAKPSMRLMPVRPARPGKPGMRVAVLTWPAAAAITSAPATAAVSGASLRQRTADHTEHTGAAGGGRPTRGRTGRGHDEVRDASPAQLTAVHAVSPGFTTAYFAAHKDALAVKEYRWQPVAGQEVPLVIQAFAPAWLLRDFSTAIVVTMVWTDEKWRPWTITAASMAMWDAGHGVQRRMYLLRDAPRGTALGFLEGDHVGTFKRSSAAKAAAVRARAHAEHSCVFCTRTASGLERLWDGAGDRPGGMAGSNDARGTARRNNAAVAWQTEVGDFTEDATIRAVRKIRAVGLGDDQATWAAREMLWSYGSDFWKKTTTGGDGGA